MAEWVREYQFMTVTHCTYEQYLDTPCVVVDRLLRIHSVFEDAKKRDDDQRAQAARTPLIM